MRPETAKRNVSSACKHFYNMYSDTSDTVNRYRRGISLLVKYRSSIIKLLSIAVKHDRMLQIEYTGNYLEPEMYYRDLGMGSEGMYDTLFYVSDRYNCVGRLKWLLSVVDYYEDIL
jgi:hypothetical protein